MSTGAVGGQSVSTRFDKTDDELTSAQDKKEELALSFAGISQPQGLTESYKNAMRNDVYRALVAFEDKAQAVALELLLIIGHDTCSSKSKLQAYGQLLELVKPAFCDHFSLQPFENGSILLQVFHIEQTLVDCDLVEQTLSSSTTESLELPDWEYVDSVMTVDIEFAKLKADCLPLNKYFKSTQLKRVKWLFVQFASDDTPAYQRYNAYEELKTHLADPRYVALFSLQPLKPSINKSEPVINGARMQIGQLVRVVEDRGAATLQQELLKYYQTRGSAFFDKQFKIDLPRCEYTFISPDGGVTVMERGDENAQSKYERVVAAEVSNPFQAGFKKMLACQSFEGDVFRHFSNGFAQKHTVRTKVFSIVSEQCHLFEFHIESKTPAELLEDNNLFEVMTADVKIFVGLNEITCFGEVYREGAFDPLNNMKSIKYREPDEIGQLYFEDYLFTEELKPLAETNRTEYQKELYQIIDVPLTSRTKKGK
ncbi:hypothetical protein D5018_04970 [Parashewanella curva]|uniref:Uncharacterized protein n=1 Tax=Parashewanella curva TaxID=2338552 RepID=A0A3L8Q074_9GAMM|nr:hypothetical protein [Parashewanella curva]RLV60820.1 hypothetical protein D5018_04970 [Parashewanella curva]